MQGNFAAALFIRHPCPHTPYLILHLISHVIHLILHVSAHVVHLLKEAQYDLHARQVHAHVLREPLDLTQAPDIGVGVEPVLAAYALRLDQTHPLV
jgi:hypothetical protein